MGYGWCYQGTTITLRHSASAPATIAPRRLFARGFAIRVIDCDCSTFRRRVTPWKIGLIMALLAAPAFAFRCEAPNRFLVHVREISWVGGPAIDLGVDTTGSLFFKGSSGDATW